ncbi:intraflagellar transport protein 74 homolog [Schistocerca piceifrons]|nr:intraflagellar transport protein 74 homolog [Schistocerca piceifrons]XP_049964778.1 intraflagellar transport protein 74 homolog isoform X1 [Schistocerca serialis cubense]
MSRISSAFSENENVQLEDRPTSRRGMVSRQSPVMEENASRSVIPHRPSTGRPPSASLYNARSAMPGTASRLASSVYQPASRLGTAVNLAGAQLNVVDRPVTQQGLTGLRTASRGPQKRQVEDKRYFEGILQMKIRELSSEISHLNKDIETRSAEQATFLIYDKRVKEMAAELTDLQGKLADYNLVFDKISTDTEKREIDNERLEMEHRNAKESNFLEQLFAQRRQKESQIQQIEIEIEQERHMADNLLAQMSPPLREHYAVLQKTNNELQRQMEELQQQLDTLTVQKSNFEDQISVSEVKQEAVRLHHKLLEAQEKRDQLLQEERMRSTPANEREQLLQRVKDDNSEIATMERQMSQMKELISKKQEELTQLEQDVEESQSERHQKYRDLRRREETMEQFLSTYKENYEQSIARLDQLESDIEIALQEISRNLARSGHLPSVEDFSVMKDNLLFKEGELEKSKKTSETLIKEQQQLQINLQKVEALEGKIKTEMETLREKMTTMTNEMASLSNLDKLREDALSKQELLIKEKEVLLEKQAPLKMNVEELQIKFDDLKNQLNDNETYAQLSNLERKLMQLEQNNFAMKEFIATKKSETDYEPLKNKVYSLVQEYNTLLKENVKKGNIAI